MTSPAVKWLGDRGAEAIRFLEALVNQDSGTYDRAEVNALADMLAGPLRDLGFTPTRLAQTTYGDHWLWEHAGTGPKRLLCVSHIDTVFSRGTARSRPFSIVGARAMGPGEARHEGRDHEPALRLPALAATDSRAWRESTTAWFLNSDEEVLSPTPRPLIRAEAERAISVAVHEPARPGGEYVIARKGAGKFFLETLGRAAHAGNQPEVGRSSVGYGAEDLRSSRDDGSRRRHHRQRRRGARRRALERRRRPLLGGDRSTRLEPGRRRQGRRALP
jgi:glutamate carboxypeptidase